MRLPERSTTKDRAQPAHAAVAGSGETAFLLGRTLVVALRLGHLGARLVGLVGLSGIVGRLARARLAGALKPDHRVEHVLVAGVERLAGLFKRDAALLADELGLLKLVHGVSFLACRRRGRTSFACLSRNKIQTAD